MTRHVDFIQLKEENTIAKSLFRYINRAVVIAEKHGNKNVLKSSYVRVKKQANEFMEYTEREKGIQKKGEHDRVFPLETLYIGGYKRKHESDIEEVLIHTGEMADEVARSLNAVAVTIGRDIYFRNNAYQPESEEGRSVLAHEMTHIEQYEEGRINEQTSLDELEREAEEREKGEIYSGEEVVEIAVRGKVIRMKKREMEKTGEKTARRIMEKVREAKSEMSEARYLEYLGMFARAVEKGAVRWLR